jgi:beta-carotene ketolase (CrtO type)
MNAFTELWWTIIPYLQDHPTRPSVSTVARVVSRAARHRRSLGVAAKIMLSSPGAVLEEWFESQEARAALANFAVGSMAPLDEPSSGFVLSPLALLVDGTQLLADTVVAAVDPYTLCLGLLGDEQLTPSLRSELRGMGVLRNDVSAFKGDVALEIRPHLPLDTSERELLSSCMMFAPTLDDVRRSTAAISRGELPDDTPIWMSVTSVLDRTLVPEGSNADTIYVYLPSVPFELVAPGVRRTVLNTSATRPIDLMKISPVHRGNLVHVDQTMAQFGPLRPTTSLSGYKTPWKGLWHTGAHPCGLMNGWSGRTTARRVLKAA